MDEIHGVPWPLLFPPVCVGCGLLLRPDAPASVPLCRHCELDHVPLPPELRHQSGITAVHGYGGPVLAALLRLKFHGQTAWAGPLGRVLAHSPVLTRGWDAVVPVPLHRARLRARGFNQAVLLARHARHAVSRPRPPVRAGWLVRVRDTPAQHHLPAPARLQNLRGAFAVPHPSRVAGKRLLLVDDVTTTGATLHAAMGALEAAGAASVGALALLRTLA